MSAIVGVVGGGDRERVGAMLAAAPYRGDRTELAGSDGAWLGYRWWGGRPGKSPAIHAGDGGALCACAGGLAPMAASPAAEIDARIRAGDLGDLDGAFAAARWEPATRTLTLLRDPFGVRSLFYVEHQGALWFATEIKQLLAIPDLPVALDVAVVHRYLAFSFVPGDEMPVAGVRRLLPGHRLTWREGRVAVAPWFELKEDPQPVEQAEATRRLWRMGRAAVERRLPGEGAVGLYLSGGLDSSAVGVWLRDLGADVRALTLDFGERSVEREEAEAVAGALGIPLLRVPADAGRVDQALDEIVWKLDLPFGDAVTGPHHLLAVAAREQGLTAVFNGEGGDQLFGGWSSKPMVAAALYGSDEAPEVQYLRSYHRFYGLEEKLYSDAMAAGIGPVGQRRALLAPWLGSEAGSFLNRVRLTDISLKGSQNILPRAERLTNGQGLDVRVPLFDLRLAAWSFTLPPALKLHGACEKYVFKLAMQGRLPDDIVWRRKFGMSVPATDWVLGGLRGRMEELLGEEAVRRRGLFRPDFVAGLRAGQDLAHDVRRRRLGERLWALMMLEAWIRRFIDQRGRAP